ncbi:MAG: CRISPR-associated endonuclease Cas1 [Ignavibacteriaceae bacterium]|nr:CRISPR-associated endonuclease Cas1 [Ignavibacteriaceae bacterium]
MMEFYNQIISYPSLLYGYYRVKENDGAAGVDRVTVDAFEDNLQKNISRLNYELTVGKYQPLPLLAFERKDPPESNSSKSSRDDKIRLLTIPAVRDRVIQSSALNILEPIIDSELEDESFAYRKGFSREGAARRINNLFNKGYCWLLDADIRKFFDTVDHTILFTRLATLLNDDMAIELIKKWVQAEYIFKNKKIKQTIGLPQGSVVSPILANLYLDKFDEEISKRGLHLVRFADDFVILTKTKTEAADALKLTQELLADLKLELNINKTTITSFNDGFKYLGYLFLNSLILPVGAKDKSKPIPFDGKTETLIEIERFKEITSQKEKVKSFKKNAESTEFGKKLLLALEKKGITVEDFISALRQDEAVQAADKSEAKVVNEDETEITTPDDNEGTKLEKTKAGLLLNTEVYAFSVKRTLYVHTQGAELRKEGERLIVIKSDSVLIDIPSLRISQVIIFGSCSITPAAMQFCLTNNIPITLLSSSGKYYGKVESSKGKNIELERLQFFTSVDETFNLALSKTCISGKITNTRTLLQRSIKRRYDTEIEAVINSMKKSLIDLSKAENIEQLRGIEGNAAAEYFSVYGRTLLKETGFYQPVFKRIKRPPVDPINSLLSFGYTLLSANIYSTVSALNLNPYVGFFHTIRQGHPALASDLIEEFRHVIDSLVIQVINKSILTRKHFYFVKDPDTPCLLTKEGRKEFIRQFEIKMNRITTHTPTGKKADYRRCILFQVQQYIKVLKGVKQDYEPMKIKL